MYIQASVAEFEVDAGPIDDWALVGGEQRQLKLGLEPG